MKTKIRRILKGRSGYLSWFIVAVIAAWGTVFPPQAQADVSTGDVKEYKQEGAEVIFVCNRAVASIRFCTADMFRVRVGRNGDFKSRSRLMVIKDKWAKVSVKVGEQEDVVRLRTKVLTVDVSKKPFGISVSGNKDGKLLCEDQAGSSGAVIWRGGKVRCVKRMHSGEHFFGFGERMDHLDWRGRKVSLNVGRGGRKGGPYDINAANYCPVPFFMSTRGYGIFLNTARKSHWNMGGGSEDFYTFAPEEDSLEYYFIYGPGFKHILGRYTELTGRAPLVPKVALGLNFGTYSGGYGKRANAEYALGVARKFRKRDIPCDVFHFDSSWRIKTAHGGSACTYEWNVNFDHPQRVIRRLHEMNYELVGVHIRSLLDDGREKKLLTRARKAGHIVRDNGLILDFFDNQAVDWWWRNCAMPLAEQGVQFVKPDTGSVYPFARRHNLFPIAYARACYDRFAAYGDRRGFTHAREGYAGIQRYPFIFAGDWPSGGGGVKGRKGWFYMRALIRGGVNIGLSGVGYWGHCMGGFEGDATDELYIRWTQFGLFNPIAHMFGTDRANEKKDDKEPWHYSAEAEKIFRKYDRLRYRLVPYIYSSCREMFKTGVPLMRALVLDYQNDENTCSVDDQYLFGPELMVAPVYKKGARQRKIYLPRGNWIDYWTGKEYQGGQNITYPAPLDRLPLLVKAGAVIPMQPTMEYLTEKPADPLTVKIYPQGESNFTLYEDDGWTMDYQKGEYALTDITCRRRGDRIEVRVGPPKGDYSAPARKHVFHVHSKARPSKVFLDDASVRRCEERGIYNNAEGLAWWYDAAKNSLCVKTQKAVKDLRLTVRLN